MHRLKIHLRHDAEVNNWNDEFSLAVATGGCTFDKLEQHTALVNKSRLYLPDEMITDAIKTEIMIYLHDYGFELTGI